MFIELLTNLERISDHCSNIAVYVIGFNNDGDLINRHEYLKRVHAGDTSDFNENLKLYQDKYFERIENIDK